MTAKNRQKNNGVSAEKSAPPSQEDAPKKSAKNAGPPSSGAQGPKSRSCLGLVVSTLFYVALIGGAGFAAFHLQKVVDEVRQSSGRELQESAERSAQLSLKMESVLQQVESLKGSVAGLQSSLASTQVELEGAMGRMKVGEVETRRVEEALQNLQNDLLRDLSEGIKEVKESREKDFSSLEKTVEERLAEVSQSIKANMAEFTESQGEAQSQLAELKARLGNIEDPALIKQELAAIVEVVAELKSDKTEADTSAGSLMEQIGSVREEIHTRNMEVTSLSQEVETMRSTVQETIGSLRKALSDTEGEVQALKDKTATMDSGVEQAVEGVRNMDKRVSEATAQVLSKSEDLEVRVKASEESGDNLSASVADITSIVESLMTKFDSYEITVASQSQAVEKVKSDLQQELDTQRNNLQQIQSTLVVVQTELVVSSSLDEQVQEVKTRLEALEASTSSSNKQEQLEKLRSMVDMLETKAARLEGHDQAIAALQKALQETTDTLAGLSGPVKKKV